MKQLGIGCVFALCLVAMGRPAEAAPVLIKSDFRSAGDGLILTDVAANLEWLSPYATRGIAVNAVLGGYGDLVTTEGFRYADASTVRGMLLDNFGPVTTVNYGDAAGFAAASQFFSVFGINDPMTCGTAIGNGPCPRTQGIALDGQNLTSLGMIQFLSKGWMLDWTSTLAAQGSGGDLQRGSWLVREVPGSTPVPEPGSLALLGTGLVGIGIAARRRRTTTPTT